MVEIGRLALIGLSGFLMAMGFAGVLIAVFGDRPEEKKT